MHSDRVRAAAPDARAEGESLLKTVRHLLHNGPAMIGDRIDLLSCELLRARKALERVVVLTLAALVFGVSAWVALWVLVVSSLLAFGWSITASVGIVLLVNVAAAVLLVARIRGLLPKLALPATRRHLTFGRARPDSPEAPDMALRGTP